MRQIGVLALQSPTSFGKCSLRDSTRREVAQGSQTAASKWAPTGGGVVLKPQTSVWWIKELPSLCPWHLKYNTCITLMTGFPALGNPGVLGLLLAETFTRSCARWSPRSPEVGNHCPGWSRFRVLSIVSLIQPLGRRTWRGCLFAGITAAHPRTREDSQSRLNSPPIGWLWWLDSGS